MDKKWCVCASTVRRRAAGFGWLAFRMIAFSAWFTLHLGTSSVVLHMAGKTEHEVRRAGATKNSPTRSTQVRRKRTRKEYSSSQTPPLPTQARETQARENNRSHPGPLAEAATAQLTPTREEPRERVEQTPLSAQRARPSVETRQAVNELCTRSCEGLSEAQGSQVRRLLAAYTDIFAARDEDCTRTSLVQHDIDTGNARPIRLQPHRLPFAKRQAAEEKIKEMAVAGVIEPSSSPWAAPAVLVRRTARGGSVLTTGASTR
ncbi:uncharacterized protein LOC121711003 [Alosa sapidissima]|uniref:uncharacterized protein LOC121711003 n=1 Tax=Alosa sapidissima TaxID=34773 RepID=UPI001C0A5B2C|nr:uncharacterized protein LOC121711003 [Alosa sapidissima]